MSDASASLTDAAAQASTTVSADASVRHKVRKGETVPGGPTPTPAATLTSTARAKDMRAFRRVMLAFALATVVSGAVIGLVPLGIDAEVSRQVSTVLLIVGLADTLVLCNWRRLFGA